MVRREGLPAARSARGVIARGRRQELRLRTATIPNAGGLAASPRGVYKIEVARRTSRGSARELAVIPSTEMDSRLLMDKTDRQRSHIFYDQLAPWWPLISAPEDYVDEAAHFAALFRQHSARTPRSLLELGSGGGNNASHLKSMFEEVMLVDAAERMLEVSRVLNPECEHQLGDMFSVRLERTFDCCLVHDAICYATSLDELSAVLSTVYEHLVPGGVAVLAPDFVRETFESGTEHGGHDHGDRGIRYLEWTWDPDPTDCTYIADYAFLIRDGTDEPRTLHDRHIEGLFSTHDWLTTLQQIGFSSMVVKPDQDDEVASTLFVAIRPASPKA